MSAFYGRHAALAWWQYPVRDLRTFIRMTHPGSVVAVLMTAALLGAALTLLIVP